MKLFRRRASTALLLPMICLLGAAAVNSASQAVETKPYLFGVVPQFEQRKLHAIWKPVIDELEKRTGLAFELVTTLQIQGYEKELAAGRFDFVYASPYHVLKSAAPHEYIPLVRDKAPLRGILVVRKDSPVQAVKDLSGKTVAFPSPNALGASLLMRADLDRLHHVRIKPLYVKTHSSVYLHVIQGLTAAGGGVEKTLREQDAAIRDSLRVIYTTRDMPSHPVAAHPRVPKAVREKVRQAFLDMGKSAEGRELLAKIPVKEIIPTSLDDYNVMSGWGLDAYWDAHWKEE